MVTGGRRLGTTPRLRPLATPGAVVVRTDGEGRPAVIRLDGKPRRVLAIREEWQIDDEWWRVPISRRYTALVLEDGRPVTVYVDLEDGRWYVHGQGQ